MRVGVVLVMAGLIAGGAACGGNTGEGATVAPSTTSTAVSTTTSPKAAFLEAGNAACKKMNDGQLALKKRYPNGPGTATEAVTFMTDTLNLMDTTLRGLRALPKPAGDEQKLDTLYASVERLSGLYREVIAAMKRGDAATVKKIDAEGKKATAAANADFIAYGLTECGRKLDDKAAA